MRRMDRQQNGLEAQGTKVCLNKLREPNRRLKVQQERKGQSSAICFNLEVRLTGVTSLVCDYLADRDLRSSRMVTSSARLWSS
jgi:hypothetical protein